MLTVIPHGPEEVCGVLFTAFDEHCGNPWKQNWTVTFPDVAKPSPNPLDVPKVAMSIELAYRGVATDMGILALITG